MPNVINEMIVRELSDSFKDAEGMLIVSLGGLTVSETEDLRDGLAEKGVHLRMVRNRLAKRAMAASGKEVPADLFLGNVAMAWGDVETAIDAAKVVSKSQAKKDGKIAVRGGLLEGNLLDAAEAAHLAKLPGRDELRAMMLGAISGPARGLVGLLAAPGGAMARVIQARVDAGAEGGEG